jgi:murein DD-endopeptidase MepM/ murein hydrolase activator NlpD
MTKRFNRLRNIAVSAITLGFSLLGCTSFQGPGDLQIGAPRASETKSVERASASTSTSTPDATLKWSGEQRTSSRSKGSPFDWPVDEARMTRGFFYGKRAHWGVDLANKRGTPILSAGEGVVVYTGRGFKGYGKLVVVEHDNDWATLYAHLDKILVKEGQKVPRGHKLGLMGRTGRASGVHLHFEVRRYKQPVNPLAFLPEAP